MATQNSVGQSVKMAFVTSLTETATTDLEGAGTLRRDQYGNVYRWVKNASTDAARAGAPACFDATNIGTSDLLQECVTEDQTTGDEMLFAGIWLAAVAGGSFGWVLVSGQYTTARVAVGTGIDIVVGDVLVPNLSTDTTDTASKPYSFAQLTARTDVWTGKTALKYAKLNDPFAYALEALGTPTTDTSASSLAVFVRGLL